MQCFTNQTRFSEFIAPIVNCTVGSVCYLKWNNVTGSITIEEQGCKSAENLRHCNWAKKTNDCPNIQLQQNVFSCCCINKKDWPCNHLNFDQPHIENYVIVTEKQIELESSLALEETTKHFSKSGTTGENTVTFNKIHFQSFPDNVTITSSANVTAVHEENEQVPLYAHLVLPLSALLLCIVVALYLWQNHVLKKDSTKPNERSERRSSSSPPRNKLLSMKNLPRRKRLCAVTKLYNRMRETETNPDSVKLLSLKGKGRFGRVWKGQYQDKIVAVKVFDMSEKQSYENELFFYSLPYVQCHTNILKFLGIYRVQEEDAKCNKGDFSLILEYHSLGTLSEYLREYTLHWSNLLKISSGIAAGLAFLHKAETSQGSEKEYTKPTVVHRDLKSNNILLKSDLTSCISDFGYAYVFRDYDYCMITQSFVQVGTKQYMAPEILDRSTGMTTEAFTNVDMYACGIVLWEVLSRCQLKDGATEPYMMPFEKELGRNPSMQCMHQAVVTHKLRPHLKDSWVSNVELRNFVDIIMECWDQDPDARISSGCVEQRLLHMIQSTSLLNDITSSALGKSSHDFSNMECVVEVDEEKGNKTCVGTSPECHLHESLSIEHDQSVQFDFHHPCNYAPASPSSTVSSILQDCSNALFIHDQKFLTRDESFDERVNEDNEDKNLTCVDNNDLIHLCRDEILEVLKPAGDYCDENKNSCCTKVSKLNQLHTKLSRSASQPNYSSYFSEGNGELLNSVTKLHFSCSNSMEKSKYGHSYSSCVNSAHNSSGRGSLEDPLNTEEMQEILDCDLDESVWDDEVDAVSGYGSPTHDVRYSHEGRTVYGSRLPRPCSTAADVVSSRNLEHTNAHPHESRKYSHQNMLHSKTTVPGHRHHYTAGNLKNFIGHVTSRKGINELTENKENFDIGDKVIFKQYSRELKSGQKFKDLLINMVAARSRSRTYGEGQPRDPRQSTSFLKPSDIMCNGSLCESWSLGSDRSFDDMTV